MKPELLVIPGQLNWGEYVLESCTHSEMCLVVIQSSPFKSDPRHTGECDGRSKRAVSGREAIGGEF